MKMNKPKIYERYPGQLCHKIGRPHHEYEAHGRGLRTMGVEAVSRGNAGAGADGAGKVADCANEGEMK